MSLDENNDDNKFKAPGVGSIQVTVSVSDAFDGGNGVLVTQRPSKEDPSVLEVLVKMKPDVYTELEDIQHMQYFCFRVTLNYDDMDNSHGLTNNNNNNNNNINNKSATPPPPPVQRVKYILVNAGDASYPEAWRGTTVLYTDDLADVDSWKRNVDTFYTQGRLWWEHVHSTTATFTDTSLYFAYFVPFSYQRHLSLISRCARSDRASSRVQSLGQTLEGREIECITVGSGPMTCWIIHRQHPGESMAEHYAEGLLTRLLGISNDKDHNEDNHKNNDDDPEVQRLLQLYTLHIVPCMCPDGAVRGHLRTNSVGANLNREWCSKQEHNYEAPTLHRSPEVHHVLKTMDETGVDCFLDIHGDEELPFNFCMPSEHVPNWNERLEALHGAFVASYVRANDDMQQRIGYPPMESPQQVLQFMNVAANQIAHRFDCFAAVVEMPFKDCLTNPDRALGWTPARARRLGASVVGPLLYIHPHLRAEGAFWKDLPPEDAFVETTDDYHDELEQNLETTNEEEEGFFKPLHKRFYSDVHEGHRHGHMEEQQTYED